MIKNLDNKEALNKLKDLIDSIGSCMFATIDENNDLFSRPMTTAEADDDGNIWFFTSEYSEKVQDISKENIVYLFYSHPGQNSYLHIKGNCSIVNDSEKIKQLWNPALKAWFPEGYEDSKICLLKVSPLLANYWDNPSGKLVELFKKAKAVVSGDISQVGNMGDLRL